MKLSKKIICAVLAVATLMQCVISYAQEDKIFSDLEKDYACYDSVERLYDLNIVNGYDDGEYKPWNYVTRAEFSKIVVAMMDKLTEAKSTSPTSAFDDVNEVKWCIPYVNYLTSNGIIKGYADATFKPNNIITYAEAVTILCRILNYQESDIGYSWPANYMNEAEALGLNGNMEFKASDGITRAAMAIITDNALFTDISAQSKQTFLESIGYTVIEDCYLLSTSSDDHSLNSDEIRTSQGVYEVENTNILSDARKMGTLVLDTDNRAIVFNETTLESMTGTIMKLVDSNTVEYKLNNSSRGTFTFNSSFVVYYDNIKTTYQQISSQVSVGSALTFYGDTKGNWSFAVIDDASSAVTPVRATKNYTNDDKYLEGTPINYDGLTVYKGNKTASVADIQINDVVYYNTKTNIMDVYNKKISGIYNEALPSKAYVTSVNVGGNIYQLNPNVSTSSLDASNQSFKIGDRITLLLGENDEVCFAVELSGFQAFDYGVVLDTYKEISQNGENEGSSQIMASIFMPDGNTYEYRTNTDYKLYIGELVKLSYNNGIVSMSKASSSGVYGDLDISDRTLAGKTVLKDVVIFHRLSEDESSEPEVELLNFDTLDATSITNAQLITSVSANAFGDIAILYVKNMASGYKYGVLRATEAHGGDSTSATYKIYHDGNYSDYQSDAKYSVSNGPVYFKLSGGKLTFMGALKSAASGKIVAVEGGRIMINSTIYKMSDDVEIINTKNISSYSTISINELQSSKNANVTIYSDRNNVVRIVLVNSL